ncbi:MAG: 2OG-Fe(II) oxygenase [Novosphingobium sp.]
MFAAPACLVIDDFLTRHDHAALLAHALASEGDFAPTVVWYGNERVVVRDSRLSWKCQTGLGEAEQRISQALVAAMPQVITAIGMPLFALEKAEIELIAHRNGSFFNQHIDTLTEEERDQVESDRMISMVYYLHALPQRFSGGELVLYPLGAGEVKVIEPRDNRLVAFPSFTPHEVKPVTVPQGDAFADARFAVNCWLHRRRTPA